MIKQSFRHLIIVTLFPLVACSVQKVSVPDAVSIITEDTFRSEDAIQGVAVDAMYIYAISNRRISKHQKSNGEFIQRSVPEVTGATNISHLNSAVIHHNQLYTAHSNWPQPSIRNSVEIWTTGELKHHSSVLLSADDAYFSWLDRYRGSWWAAFVEYPTATQEISSRYLSRLNTQIVKMDDSFRIINQYRLPVALLQRLYPMSNSGASWGPDGCLYLTGHDHSELYVTRLPKSGDTLIWVTTIKSPDIQGQGISWDRFSSEPRIYGIRRSSREILNMRIQTAKPSAANSHEC